MLASLPETERLKAIGSLDVETRAALLYRWRFWARSEQLPPTGEWQGWLYIAGRGAGKTRSGTEWVLDPEGDGSGPSPDDRIALVAPTTADVRDVIVEGESGILNCAPPWNRPIYEPSKRRLTWQNGAIATTYSADEPERLRGPQHTRGWCDEIATWRYGPETWSNFMFGLRIGPRPRWVATTTPRRVQLVRDLLAMQDRGVVVTRETTYDNRVNLAPAFLDQIIGKYEGTRLGRQELLAELLEDVPGALWTRALIENSYVKPGDEPDFVRVVVAIDPAMTSGEEADETGIVVAAKGVDGHAYVLADRTCRLSPDGWARRAVEAFHEFRADRIVAETNNGGEMVELTIRVVDPAVSYKAVHASHGKRVRAEPVAALYEQGKVHHVGSFPELEDQECTFVPDQTDISPDRVDALVWALTELMLEDKPLFVAVIGA